MAKSKVKSGKKKLSIECSCIQSFQSMSMYVCVLCVMSVDFGPTRICDMECSFHVVAVFDGLEVKCKQLASKVVAGFRVASMQPFSV